MNEARFRPKSGIYYEDYECVLRTPQNEWDSGMHYHDFYECVIYLGNAGVCRIEDREYLIRRGDIALIDMFTPHVLITNKNDYYERFSIDIDPGLLISYSTTKSNLVDLFHNRKLNKDPIHSFESHQLCRLVELLDKYRANEQRRGRDILRKALVHEMLAIIYDECYISLETSANDSQTIHIISKIISYINVHLSEEITLGQLAREVNYSEYYICRLFKRITGKTLITYIQEKRINCVAQMLRQGTAVRVAAEAVGFNNYSYFFRTFKRLKGCSPAEYKEKKNVQESLKETDLDGAQYDGE